jgi:hypothetical protein
MLHMYKLIFTDANKDRLIYHRNTRIIYVRDYLSVILAVSKYGSDYATVRIQIC